MVLQNKKMSGSSLSSIIHRKVNEQVSAEEFCADFSNIKAHLDEEFTNILETNPSLHQMVTSVLVLQMSP